MDIIYALSGVVVLAVAIGELEWLMPFKKGAKPLVRILSVAWYLIAIGAGGAVVSILIHSDYKPLANACSMLGLAILCGLKIKDKFSK